MRSRFSRIRWRFQLAVGAQVAALLPTVGALAWTLARPGLPAVTVVLLLLIVAQFAGLIAYTSSEHRKLERFLDALAFDDLSLRLTEGDWDRQLARAANHILTTVRDARVETEAKATYLDVLVRHIPVAILAIDPAGSVVMQNNAARRLFQRPRLATLEDLADFGAHLPRALAALRPGEERLLRATDGERVLELKVSATEIRLAGDAGGSVQTLLALENIFSELDDREIAAWRDLIRVLTHEIMNSITPIASLARTVDGMAEELGSAEDGDEMLADIHDALATIVRRSEGLIAFVEGYRRLTQLPQPHFATRPVAQLLADVQRLCAEEFGDALALDVSVTPATLSLSADHALVQQALLNVARNACLAVAGRESPRVDLLADIEHGRVRLRVVDNGCGIDDEVLAQIFIPFFTTRRGGSGVGMTLARQIMAAHRGTIGVRSEVDQGTTVTMTF